VSHDLAIVVSHGFAARMVLHSDLLPELLALGLRVAVVAPDLSGTSAAERLDALGVARVVAPRPSRSDVLHGEWRPYLFEDVRRNPALWAKHLRARHAGSWTRRLEARARMAVHRALAATPMGRAALGALDRAWARSREAEEQIAALDARMLVTTYPVAPMEAALVLAAQAAGVRTVGHLLSWDNLSTKGRFSAVPERWVAWGPVMREELAAYYGVPDAHVRTVGVPHFDAHVRVDGAERDADVVALGLDPARPLLLFGMSAPVFCPHEIDLVEWLAAEVRRDAFGSATQLVVRPHPQNVQGNMADRSWLPRLQALKGPRVAVDMPRLEDSAMAWSMDPGDLGHLARLISASSVTLNSGSTLCIDALVQDRPVVMTPFDPVPGQPWWASARRIEAYPHLARLLSFGGIEVARSLDDLRRAISADLADPGRRASGRRAAREAELSACDGRAAARAAAAYAHFLHEA
jgi:hypothetical protein